MRVSSAEGWGLGFLPVGYRERIPALLILPLMKPPAPIPTRYRRDPDANQQSVVLGRACPCCGLFVGPRSSSAGAAPGAGSRPGWQHIYLSVVEIRVLSPFRCPSYFLNGYCSANCARSFIFGCAHWFWGGAERCYGLVPSELWYLLVRGRASP